jgi:hypothetical protein
MPTSHFRALRSTALGLAAALVAVSIASAQSDDDASRGLGDFGFLRLRPVATKTSTPHKRPVYKRATPATTTSTVVPTPSAGDTLVGVTVWRLRPAAKSDGETARILVQEAATSGGDGEWTPERVDLDTPLAEGQHVRLAIETPRDGYLYVVDREVYSDGSTSPPVLIFPTTRTRGGNNRVNAGAIVEIPALTDDRAYFTVKRSRPDQTAESLTVIVTPTPLDGVTITNTAQVLDAKQFAAWARSWGGPVERVDLAGGVGTVYTPTEKASGASADTRLTQNDPAPQTIFRIAGHAGSPVLVTFPLKIQ